MDTRIQRVIVETTRFRIIGDVALPTEGFRTRLSDVLNRQDTGFIPLVDVEMEPYMQRRVYEVRPELSFYQLAEDEVVKHTKDSKAGQAERQDLLRRRMPGSERIIDAELQGVRLTHLTDAAVTLWTARRIAARAVSRVPEDPEWDDKGLRMQILR